MARSKHVFFLGLTTLMSSSGLGNPSRLRVGPHFLREALRALAVEDVGLTRREVFPELVGKKALITEIIQEEEQVPPNPKPRIHSVWCMGSRPA